MSDDWKGPGEKPHTYSPDIMAMGDCRICGHTYEAHQPKPTPDTRDALIKELVGALAFYADKNGDGYDSEVRNYGLSLYTGAIVDDGGECARAALTRAKEAGYGAE